MSELNMETALCRYLRTHHTGRQNAASSKTLEAVFHVKGAEIRKTVNALRCGGFPVCSDTAGSITPRLRRRSTRPSHSSTAG